MVVRIETISGGTVVFGNVGCISSRSSETSASGSGGSITGDGATTNNAQSTTQMSTPVGT